MAEKRSGQKKEPAPGGLLGGILDILGLKIDLGELLSSPENLAKRLEELREKLVAAGGKGVLSAGEWRQGGAVVTGHIRVRGLSGDEEYHVGTLGKTRRKVTEEPPGAPETVEPPLDVFDEPGQVTVVADVPGVGLQDLDLHLEGNTLSISTKPVARRQYQKTVQLTAEVHPESMEATCRNGTLEVRLRKRKAGQQ